jgi:raffinose/stachyose/melibiose transport system substrate-binding protein
MKNFFKKIAVVLAVLIALSFVSCNKNTQANSGGKTRTITWMTVRPLYQNTFQAVVSLTEEYMAAHPGFKVEFQSIQDRPSYYQKLKILASNNELPEIFDAEGDSLTAQIASTGVLLDIDQLYRDLNMTDRVVNIGKNYARLADGKLYCLAWENNVEYIWYHKDLFAKAGIRTPPETFDEFLEACEKLKTAKITPIATWGNEGWPLFRWMAFIPFRRTGNDFIESLKVGNAKMADPVGLEAARFFQTLGMNYFQPGWATAGYDDALDAFLSSNAAMYYIGSWQFNSFMGEDGELKEDYAFMYMPTVPGAVNGKTDVWAHAGTGTAIRKDTFDDQVKDYIAFILDKFPEAAWYMTKTFPPMDFDTAKAGLSSFEQQVMNDTKALTSYGYCWDVRMDAASTEVMTKEIINLGMGTITPDEFASRTDAAIAVNAPKFFE